MSPLRALVERFKNKRIVVLGDLVADVFLYGEISRISREAPVLILNHRETQTVPGGGANAIHNLWALGAKPIPVGIIGDDSEGHQLVQFFSDRGIDVSGIRVAKSYRTPTKMRILAGAIHSQRQTDETAGVWKSTLNMRKFPCQRRTIHFHKADITRTGVETQPP